MEVISCISEDEVANPSFQSYVKSEINENPRSLNFQGLLSLPLLHATLCYNHLINAFLHPSLNKGIQ